MNLKSTHLGTSQFPLFHLYLLKAERERERAVNFQHVIDHTYQLSQFTEREREMRDSWHF